MHALPELAARVAARRPLPALSLDLLVDLVRRERPGPPPDPGALREALERRPDLFRVLEAWPPAPPGRDRPRSLREPASPGGAWILFLGPADGAEDLARPLRIIRESLIALGRTVELDSRSVRARWIRRMRESARISETLVRHPMRLGGARVE